jgi:hypothetical protein
VFLIGFIEKYNGEAAVFTKTKQLHYEFHRWNQSGFSMTGAGTGLKKLDRTGPAGLPVTGRSNF